MIIQFTKPNREVLKQLNTQLEQLKTDYEKQRLELEAKIKFIKSGNPIPVDQ